jgi:microsomal dipeptidase-like Zn-dependent dipeptidase
MFGGSKRAFVLIIRVSGVLAIITTPAFAKAVKTTDRKMRKSIYEVKGFALAEDSPNVSDGLAQRGYKPREIDLIMGDNFVRVIKEVIG